MPAARPPFAVSTLSLPRPCRRRAPVAWIAAALVAGCAPSVGDADTTGADGGGSTSLADGSTGTGGGSMSTTASMTGTPSDTGEQDSSGGVDSGQVFVVPPDGGGGASECDPRVQDCPRGQKCSAWANDGGTFWNATRCIDVGGRGVAGDTCTTEGGGVSGIDDCAAGFICLNTDQNGQGTCVEFCQGDNRDCGPGDVCAIYNDGVLPICLVGCDPLLQDCPMTQSCIDTPNGQFICFSDASGNAGLDGDACPPDDGENSCDPGLWCGPGSSGCDSVNCCTPYCDLADPQCMSPDVCTSFYGDPDSAPPGFEDVGVCVLP